MIVRLNRNSSYIMRVIHLLPHYESVNKSDNVINVSRLFTISLLSSNFVSHTCSRLKRYVPDVLLFSRSQVNN